MSQVRLTVSEEVIQRVANAKGVDTLDLPTLFDTVDPDALNAVVETMTDGEVTFTYAGYEVTVTSDGAVDLGKHPSKSHTITGNCIGDD